MKSNPSTLLLPLAALSLASCANQKKEETKRPNIIFMMTDDHTTQAMSCYGGNLIQTPNMDRIANEGIRFDNCYAVNALSGPSRACILTGKFSHENGFTDNASTFNGDQQTFPKLLQQAGYQTAMIGKWHLISEPQGFDHWSILSGQHEQGDYYDPDFWEDGKHIVEKGYATDIITDKAIDFLENRDKNKPFCMMYHQKAPHRNWMPAPRHLGIFNNTIFPEPANLFDDYEGRGKAAREQDMSIEHTLTNDWDLKLLTREEMLKDTTNRLYSVYKRMPVEVQDKWDSAYAQRIAEYRKGDLKGKALISWKYQQYMRDYLATVLAVDENIGRLLNYLEKIGELDNTIIVYTSDQGFFLGEHGWFDKRFMYEECQRMPLIIRYPKAIKAGSTSNAISMNVDFAPTFLDFAIVLTVAYIIYYAVIIAHDLYGKKGTDKPDEEVFDLGAPEEEESVAVTESESGFSIGSENYETESTATSSETSPEEDIKDKPGTAQEKLERLKAEAEEQMEETTPYLSDARTSEEMYKAMISKGRLDNRPEIKWNPIQDRL